MRGFFDRFELALVIAAPCVAFAVFEALAFAGWGHPVLNSIEAIRPDPLHAAAVGLVATLFWVVSRRRRTTTEQNSERDAALIALRESETRFRAIYDHAGTGILLASPLGEIVSANQAFQDLVGYDDEELKRTGWQKLIHPDDGRVDTPDASLRDRGVVGDNAIERQFVRKDGKAIWVRLTTTYAFDEYKRPVLGIAIAEDVSAQHEAEDLLRHTNEELERRVDARTQELRNEIADRVKAEEALGKSEQKFRALIENALDFVFVINRDGTIRYQSPSVSTAMGFAEDELVGSSIFQGIHPSDAERMKESFFRLVEIPNATDTDQLRVRDAQGQWHVLEAYLKNLLNDPLVNGIVINSRDITQRCQAEESARRREHELAHLARVSTIGEMAAGFAHELNQPLTAIQNYAAGCMRRLRLDIADNDQLCEAMESVIEQSQRAGEIIRRIRWFVRRDASEMTPVDINAIIREAMALMESDAHHAGIAVRFDLAPDLPWARADTTQIQQVVINIARNGIEAMSNHETRRELLIRSRSLSADEVEVAVRDTGPGIPREARDRLFDPFFSTKSGGLGMGLSISRSIIERHDGRLYLGTQETNGAEICFTLQAFDNVVPLARGTQDPVNSSGGMPDPDNGHRFN